MRNTDFKDETDIMKASQMSIVERLAKFEMELSATQPSEVQNTNLDTLMERLNSLESHYENLKKNMETGNKQGQSTTEQNETVINHVIEAEFLIIMDSNGKRINPQILNKDAKSQKLIIYTLKSVLEEIPKCTIKEMPKKILLNVGLNDFDKTGIEEIRGLYDQVIDMLKKTFPMSTLYISSIFFRKDEMYKDTIE